MRETILCQLRQKSSKPAFGSQLLNSQEAESIRQKSLAIRIAAARTGLQMHRQANARKAQESGL
jgi:hypothetical protein